MRRSVEKAQDVHCNKMHIMILYYCDCDKTNMSYDII